jgi:hypothetical protein
MGREVRRVPATWVHPRDPGGDLVPMYEHFPYNDSEVQEGLAAGWLVNEPPHYGVPVMPQWPHEERTHYMLYATDVPIIPQWPEEDRTHDMMSTTKGTPLSPAMPTPEALAQWLVDRQTRLCADAAASYATWLAVIRGSAPPEAMEVPPTPAGASTPRPRYCYYKHVRGLGPWVTQEMRFWDFGLFLYSLAIEASEHLDGYHVECERQGGAWAAVGEE